MLFRSTNRQTDRQTDRETGRQTDRHNPAAADRKRPAAHPKPSGYGASANTHRDAHAHTHAHARKNGRVRVKAFGGDATLDACEGLRHTLTKAFVCGSGQRPGPSTTFAEIVREGPRADGSLKRRVK